MTHSKLLRFTKLLALETSGRSGTVALAMDNSTGDEFGVAIDSEPLDPDFGSAKTLAPAIVRLLDRHRLAASDLDCIAVISGPGSFTGLRVGVATAKALAYGAKVPLVQIDTLDVIASQFASMGNSVGHAHSTFATVLDAYRGQLFFALYRANQNSLSTSDELPFHKLATTQIGDIEPMLGLLFSDPEMRSAPTFVGPGCRRIREHLASLSTASTAIEPRSLERMHCIDGPDTFPLASTVAILGLHAFRRGETVDPFAILPRYYRGSAAEEKAACR